MRLDSYTRVQQIHQLQSKISDIDKSIHFQESSCSASEHAKNFKNFVVNLWMKYDHYEYTNNKCGN